MNKTIVLKYGGNAMTDDSIKFHLIKNICLLKEEGNRVIIVHGGGPFIKQVLEQAGIKSEFVDGQRVTPPNAMRHVEMALKGKVNGNLVALINSLGHTAVGLSGKDGKTVIAKKRYHQREHNGKTEQIDIGQVGDVKSVDTSLLDLLLDHDYMPVVTCLASDESGNDYNINGDIFAGHIAGSLNASEFIVLTDVDGLMKDIEDPDSLIDKIRLPEIQALIDNGTIRGGMIPKLEACKTALQNGARNVRIINGTKPGQLMDLINNKKIGTLLTH